MKEDFGPFNLQVGDEVVFRNGLRGVVKARTAGLYRDFVVVDHVGLEVSVWAGGRYTSTPHYQSSFDVVSVGPQLSVEEYL